MYLFYFSFVFNRNQLKGDIQMSKQIVYEENQELPVVTSYLDRMANDVLTELSDGKGDDEDDIQ